MATPTDIKYIVIGPGVLGGRPTIAGHRIGVIGRNPAPASHSELSYEFVRRARVRAPALLDLKIARQVTARPATGGDGMPYDAWKARHQTEADPRQQAA